MRNVICVIPYTWKMIAYSSKIVQIENAKIEESQPNLVLAIVPTN